MIIVRKETPLPERRDKDAYPTPVAFVDLGMQVLADHWTLPFSHDLVVLDPGAGEGVWGQRLRATFPGEFQTIAGIELRDLPRPEGYDLWAQSDFLDESRGKAWLGTVDLVIGNPPFAFSERFVRRSFDFLKEGGLLLFLLPLTFLEGKKRGAGLYAEYPPRVVAVTKDRPHFTGNRPHMACCFMLWQKGWKGTTSLRWV